MLPNCCVVMVKVCCNQSVGLLGETHTKQMIGPQQMWGNVEMEPRICQVVSKRKTDFLSFFFFPHCKLALMKADCAKCFF